MSERLIGYNSGEKFTYLSPKERKETQHISKQTLKSCKKILNHGIYALLNPEGTRYFDIQILIPQKSSGYGKQPDLLIQRRSTDVVWCADYGDPYEKESFAYFKDEKMFLKEVEVLGPLRRTSNARYSQVKSEELEELLINVKNSKKVEDSPNPFTSSFVSEWIGITHQTPIVKNPLDNVIIQVWLNKLTKKRDQK